MTDATGTENATLLQALVHLEALCEFAYKHGFHELGYDPLHVIKKQCVPVLQSRLLPPVWDGTIVIEQDAVINGMKVPAGKYTCGRK